MEDQHDTLSNHELRQLWTRFEGLVGHQLSRLQVDGRPNNNSAPVSPSKAASSGAVLAGCSSSMCSIAASELSSLTTATSPAGFPELRSCHDDAGDCDGYVEEEDGGDTKLREDVFRGSPVDGSCVVGVDERRDGGSCVDGHGSNVADDEEADGGCGDGADVDASSSCCQMSSDGSSRSQVFVGQSSCIKRNSTTNAVNSCEGQPLFGLPYVARAAGPLLSLLNVTLGECDGKSGPLADTLLRLKGKRRECKRNMIGVYKQSLLLESQLHQYLNPGLVISLNRRVARATFDADMMAKLIDKLRKETKKSVDDPERKSKVIEVSTKIKSLLGRQKCEWQCVGRLKETLTMAKEMKDLLRFIARLSNTLEKSKTTFEGLQERPPPYEYCSPYTEIPIALGDAVNLQEKNVALDSQLGTIEDSNSKLRETPDSEGPVNKKNSSSSIAPDLSAVSDCGRTDASDDHPSYLRQGRGRGRSIKDHLSSRSRSLTPRRLGRRSPAPKRSRSTDFELDSYSSFRDSNVLSKSSAKDDLSENSNVGNPIVFNLSNMSEERGAGREWSIYQVSREDDSYSGLMHKGRRFQIGSSDEPPRNKRKAGDFERECEEGAGSFNGDRCTTCKTVKNGSPPRACPKEDRCRPCKQDNSGEACPSKNDRCSGRTCVIEKRKQNTRWDRSGPPRGKLSDVEGFASAGSFYPRDNSFKNDLENDVSVKSLSRSKGSPAPMSKSPSSPKHPGSPGAKGAQSSRQSKKSRGGDSCSDGGTPDCMDDPDLPSCDSSGGSDGPCGSGSILIDIESEYPQKNQTPCASCPPGCRRIRVKVNKRSSSTSACRKSKVEALEEKHVKDSEEPEAFGEEEDENRKSGVGSCASDTMGDVMEHRMSSTGPADTQLQAVPSPPCSITPNESPMPKSTEEIITKTPTPRTSQQEVVGSPHREGGSIQRLGGSQQGSHYSSATVVVSGASREGLQSSLPDISNYPIPGLGRLDEPWKLILAGLLLLLLLLWLFSGRCCGCGYFPNPLFFLTNSLAGRVTLRHNGLAPT